MPKDSLYCQECGEDIHIVPDFDPELDYQMHQIWTEAVIASEARDERVQETYSEEYVEDETKHFSKSRNRAAYGLQNKPRNKHKSKLVKGILWCLFSVGAVFLGAAAVIIYQFSSPDYQARKGTKAVEAMHDQDTMDHYPRALPVENQELRFSLEKVP
jgi:hypothetical protein